MKTCYLDANVLVYFKNEESSYFKKADKLLQRLVEENYQLFISPLVLDEFLYAIKFLLQNKKIGKSKTFRLLRKVLKEILALPNLGIANPPLEKQAQLEVISLMKKFGLRPRDAYHLLIMKENGIQFFATFDKDFKTVFKKDAVSPINLQVNKTPKR